MREQREEIEEYEEDEEGEEHVDAHAPGDPRRGGSLENWYGKTNCITCILGLNMRRCSATQYVSHTARAHQVTHEGVGHQKTG